MKPIPLEELVRERLSQVRNKANFREAHGKQRQMATDEHGWTQIEKRKNEANPGPTVRQVRKEATDCSKAPQTLARSVYC
jgi:hypothetical protein